MATTTTPAPPKTGAQPLQRPRRGGPLPVRFYRSAIGKKWVMAITGIVLLLFVAGHLLGNIKLFLSKEEINLYGEALRNVPSHLLPRTWLLWTVRIGLIVAFVLHIHAAYGLTVINHKARPVKYQSKRDYVAADWASRTMRYTGVIILLFLLFHLADLTWGQANSEFVRGDAYNNLIYSLQRPIVALLYGVSMVALAFHLYHGTWSLFQSMGLNNPRYNKARRGIAIGFAVLIGAGNLAFPIAVQLHAVDLECPHTQPVTAVCTKEALK